MNSNQTNSGYLDNRAFGQQAYPEEYAKGCSMPLEADGYELNIVWPCPPFSHRQHRLAPKELVERHLTGMMLSLDDLERGYVFHFNNKLEAIICYRLSATWRTIQALKQAYEDAWGLEGAEALRAKKLPCLMSMQLWGCGSYIAIAKLNLAKSLIAAGAAVEETGKELNHESD